MRNVLLLLLGLAYRLLKRTPLVRAPLARQMYYRIYQWGRPANLTQVDVEGNRLWIDPKDQGIASFLLISGSYEPFEVSIVQRLLRSGACCVDIGANVGYYTVIAARAVGTAGRVHAFEPDTHNFQLLQRNIQANQYTERVVAHQCAIADRSGQGQLYLSQKNLGDHRIAPTAGMRTAVDVPLRALDEIISPGTDVDLIKMDIQGAEFLALLGMSRLLDENPNLAIVTEFWPQAMQACGSDPADFLRFVIAQQLAVYQINERKRQLKKLSRDQFERSTPAKLQGNLLLARGRYEQMADDLT